MEALSELGTVMMVMCKLKCCVSCCGLSVEEVAGIYALGSKCSGSFMDLVARHLLSSELQSEVYSDLKNVGENNQMEKICLEEVQTPVWFILLVYFLVYFLSDIAYCEI